MAKRKFVKIKTERGYGSKPFAVIGETMTEYTVVATDVHPWNRNKEKFNIYKAHCYEDAECRRKSGSEKISPNSEMWKE